MKIDKISLNFHCGSDRNVVNKQMESFKFLEENYEIDYNLRIDRYPKSYPSYSQLMNHAIATSKHEWMIFINDRVVDITKEQIDKTINLLENGFACTLLYNVAFMGFAKELVRTIGWWDFGYLLGGFEDRDWVYRLREADLSLYESQEASYVYNWKSPLQDLNHKCRLSEPYWNKKWENGKYSDAIIRMSPEPDYEVWNYFLGESIPEIKDSWKPWADSLLNGPGFDKPNSGQSSSSMLKNRPIYNYEDIKHLIKL